MFQVKTLLAKSALLLFLTKLYLALGYVQFSSVSFILSLCTPFEASQVVCSAHLRLLAPRATRLLLQ